MSAAQTQAPAPQLIPITPAELDFLIARASLQRKELLDDFYFVEGDPLLTQRFLTAGRAVADLRSTLVRLRAGL